MGSDIVHSVLETNYVLLPNHTLFIYPHVYDKLYNSKYYSCKLNFAAVISISKYDEW